MSETPPLLDDLGFGRLFAAIRDAVIVAEATSEKIVLWNAAAERLFGYTAEEATGMYIEDLVPSELKTRHREGLRNYAQGGSGPLIGLDTGTELPALHKDGRTLYVELVLTPIESASRPGRFVMAILRDATERHMAEEALLASSRRLEEVLAQEQAANEKLVALDDLKNEFIAIVAHDLRSPMSVISGFAQTLVESWDDFDDPVKKDFMARIASSVDNLSQLVEDVLQVARLEGGEFTYQQEPFDLVALTRRTVDEVSVGFPEYRFDISAPEDLLFALADEQRSWQVLTNLLSNAVKFSPPGSRVALSITGSGKKLQVSIEDEGVGISPADQLRVFDKFSRIHPKGMRKPKGTGLGLYICKSMVEAQGGEISVSSEVGKGTTVTFTLPAAAGS